MGKQRAEDVGVRRRRGSAARTEQAGLAGAGGQVGGVDQVAVVAQCDAGACGGVAEHRLGVLPRGGAAGGVPAVADGDVALHGGQGLLIEDLADQAEVLEHKHLRAIGDSDACRLLAAVLKRVQAVVAEFGDVFTRRPDAEYATLFAGFWIGLLAGHDMAAPRAGWVTTSVYGHHGLITESNGGVAAYWSTTVANVSFPRVFTATDRPSRPPSPSGNTPVILPA